MPAPLFALALLGIRILPYAIRLAKAGRKIQQIGYKVIVENPKYLNLAKKIWKEKFQVISARNVKGLTETQMLGRFSTSAQRFETVTAEEITKFVGKNAIKSKNISTIANNAGSKISQFVIKHPARPYGPLSQTVERGGATLANDIKLLFGKGVKLSDKVLKDIKLAESGALALGREVIKAPIKAGTIAEQPIVATGKGQVIKAVKKFKEKLVAPKIPLRTGKELATQITTVEKAPWYVAIMPKFLRTTKEVLKRPDAKEALLGKATERIVTPAVHWGRVGTGAAIGTAIPAIIGGMTPEEKEAESTARDLDYNQLFGITGTEVPEDLDIPSAIQTFSD